MVDPAERAARTQASVSPPRITSVSMRRRRSPVCSFVPGRELWTGLSITRAGRTKRTSGGNEAATLLQQTPKEEVDTGRRPSRLAEQDSNGKAA